MDFSPRHSAACGPARKPGPHTQRKLPGVFSQRPGAQGGGTRRHSSTSAEGMEGPGHQEAGRTPAPTTPSTWLTQASGALGAEPETRVAGAGVATGPGYAASWATDLGVALTHAQGRTWGGVQSIRVLPPFNSLPFSSQYSRHSPLAWNPFIHVPCPLPKLRLPAPLPRLCHRTCASRPLCDSSVHPNAQ